MKKIIFSLIIQSLVLTMCIAQEVDRPKGFIKKIEINNLYGDIVLKGTNGDNIEVELLKNNEIPNELLEKINNKNYQYEQSNSSLDLNFSESGTILSIYPGSKLSQFSDYLIKVPNDFIVKIKNDLTDFGGYTTTKNERIESEINIENIKNNIEIETHFANINAQGITGPIAANSHTGDIKIVFYKISQELPSSIETHNGDIDITLSSESNCNITLNTVKGKYNSELDFNDVDPNYKPNFRIKYSDNGKKEVDNSQKINSGAFKGKMNKGGVDLKLDTYSGNINLIKL